MTDLTTLLHDTVVMLRSCPGIVAELDGAEEAIAAYVDVGTDDKNSLVRATYMQPNGTVMIAWMGTSTGAGGEMEGWAHAVDITVRAVRKKSPLTLVRAVVDGVPEGTDLRWRYQCVNDEVLPVSILSIDRMTDEESIDTCVIHLQFKEKGDT